MYIKQGFTPSAPEKMTDISQTTFSYAFTWMKISLKFSLKFVPKVRINNDSALVQILTWHRPGEKPLWVNRIWLSLGLDPPYQNIVDHLRHMTT